MIGKKRVFVIALGSTAKKSEKREFFDFREKIQSKKQKIPTVNELLKSGTAVKKHDGILIDFEKAKSTRLLETIEAISELFMHPLLRARQVAERIAIIKQLKKLGYKVAVPNYENTQDKAHSKIQKHARVFKANKPLGGILTINGEEKTTEHPSSFWTRDLWKKIEGRRIKRFTNKGENLFGEEGKSITLPNKVILANSSMKQNPTVKALAKKGYRFFFTQNGEAIDQTFSELLKTKVFVSHRHIDLFAGTIGNILLVNPDFYLKNKEAIAMAAREAKLRVLFVPEKEKELYPANFLPLEENTVMVDRDAKQTIRLLEENKVKVIPTIVSLKANRKLGGNIRCFTNEL